MGAANSNVSSRVPSRFCAHCGQRLEQGLRFCPNCGQRVAAAGRSQRQELQAAEQAESRNQRQELQPAGHGQRQELRNSEAIAPLLPLATHDDFVDPRESRVSYIGIGAGAALLAVAALLGVFFALGILPPKEIATSSAPLVQTHSAWATLTEANATDAGTTSTDAAAEDSSAAGESSKSESSTSEPSKSATANKDDKNKKDKLAAAQYPPVFNDAVASTTLAPDQYVSYYGALNAIDHNLTTAWNEGAKGPGKGEWLRLQASGEQRVSGLRIVAGYPKNEAVYKNNNRPKEITIELSDGYKLKTTLNDEFGGWQRVEFDEAHATKSVTLTINSVYSGSKYDDTSFAEVEVF
ncbi:MAG: hypothetical protein IJ125_02330 [Atopobiaceae bacterium]|nr:hypothetical protein [Atopobiaceae bacterium]